MLKTVGKPETVFKYIHIWGDGKIGARELFHALKRTVRRWGALHDDKKQLYTTLTSRTFRGNIEDPKDIEIFVDTIIADLNTSKREEHIWSDGFLIWTLDHDGNTWDHTKQQKRIWEKYGKVDVEKGAITQEDYELVTLTMKFHDIGEGARWDVVFDDKTTSAEEFERKCWEILIKKIIKEKFQSGQENMLPRILEAYNINFDNTHRLHIFFKVSEIFSYLKGAMIARRKPEYIIKRTYQVHNVLVNQIRRLNEFKNIVPSIQAFIQDNKGEIDDLFTCIEEADWSTLEGINGKNIEQHKIDFYEAKRIRETELQ